MNKSGGSRYSMVTTNHGTVFIYLKVGKRANPECYNHTQNMLGDGG